MSSALERFPPIVRQNAPGRWSRLWRSRYLVLLALPGLLYYLIFRYLPMYGLLIAFKDFDVFGGFARSPWVGFRWFHAFFVEDPYAWRVIRNTLLLSLYSLLFGFPAPVVLAIMVNEVHSTPFRRTVQTLTYLPHFISLVILMGIVVNLLSPSTGIVNTILESLGGRRVYFLAQPQWFRPVYVVTGIWQNVGWGSIVYLAALSGVNPELYEAADMDGASRLRRIFAIDVPALVPTMVVLSLLGIGGIMGVGAEKVILLYNPLVYETADVISTYVYRRGLVEANFSYGTAIGLVNGLIGLGLVAATNALSRRATQTSLW